MTPEEHRRRRTMIDLYLRGATTTMIAEAYGVSRQRINAILHEHGLQGADRGRHLQNELAAIKRQQR